MKRIFVNLPLLILLSFVLKSCAPKADFSVSNNADFRRYHTYAWLEPQVHTENPKYQGDILDSKIKQSVQAEFAKRGIYPSNANPDFYVTYQTYTQEKQRVYNSYAPAYGFSPFWGSPYYGGYYGPGWGMGYGYGYGSPSVYNYTEGTLVLDVIDAKTNKEIWRGSIDGDVTNSRKLDKAVAKGVHQIMGKFPVKEGGELSAHAR